MAIMDSAASANVGRGSLTVSPSGITARLCDLPALEGRSACLRQTYRRVVPERVVRSQALDVEPLDQDFARRGDTRRYNPCWSAKYDHDILYFCETSWKSHTRYAMDPGSEPK